MQELKAKFQLQDMLPIAITLLVVGVGVAFGLNAISDIQPDFCTDGYGTTASGLLCANSTGGESGHNESLEFNASVKAMEGIKKFPDKLPLIATVVIAAIVIGILVRYLFVAGR